MRLLLCNCITIQTQASHESMKILMKVKEKYMLLQMKERVSDSSSGYQNTHIPGKNKI